MRNIHNFYHNANCSVYNIDSNFYSINNFYHHANISAYSIDPNVHSIINFYQLDYPANVCGQTRC